MKLVTTKLGGKLEPFADVSKGYRLAKPLGWNRYDGTSGEYTVKMVDLVEPTTLILLTNSPVKSDTEVGRVLDFEDAVRSCESVRCGPGYVGLDLHLTDHAQKARTTATRRFL